jgi:DNA-binding CsgD family transcriptional regulator
LFAALGIGVLLLDEQRRVCLVNDVLSRALGLNRHAEGAAVDHLLPKAWVDALYAVVGDGSERPERCGVGNLELAWPSDGAVRLFSVEVRCLAADLGKVGAVEGRWVLVAVRALDAAEWETQRGEPMDRSPRAAASPNPLSPRENEVLRWISEGWSTKSIAAQLGIAATTVETYRRQIMTKLRLRTIAELTKYAVRHKLTPP